MDPRARAIAPLLVEGFLISVVMAVEYFVLDNPAVDTTMKEARNWYGHNRPGALWFWPALVWGELAAFRAIVWRGGEGGALVRRTIGVLVFGALWWVALTVAFVGSPLAGTHHLHVLILFLASLVILTRATWKRRTGGPPAEPPCGPIDRP